jgi:hypothetical protein
MEAVADSRKQAVSGNRTMVQGWVDRDAYFVFRDFCASHKLTIGQGIGWAIRSLLMQAGVKVRRDRVDGFGASNGQ